MPGRSRGRPVKYGFLDWLKVGESADWPVSGQVEQSRTRSSIHAAAHYRGLRVDIKCEENHLKVTCVSRERSGPDAVGARLDALEARIEALEANSTQTKGEPGDQ